MTAHKLLALVSFLTASLSFAHAADLAGKWTAEFDSQIGVQKYSYEFKSDGGKLSGTAHYDHSMGQGDVVLKDIKLTDSNLSFTEPLKFNDMEVIISYSGKLTGDELKLTRKVGDFGTEDLVAKRAKADPAATAPAKK